MEGKRIVLFEVLNNTMNVVMSKKPSNILPFKGDLPLVEPWQEDLFREGTVGRTYLDECEPWIQIALISGQRIVDIENSFREYLNQNGIVAEYFSMDGKKKAAEILRFLNANSLTVDDLVIQTKSRYGNG